MSISTRTVGYIGHHAAFQEPSDAGAQGVIDAYKNLLLVSTSLINSWDAYDQQFPGCTLAGVEEDINELRVALKQAIHNYPQVKP